MLQLIERLSAKNKGKNQQSTDFVRVSELMSEVDLSA
jgi:hypothetical protein